MFDLETALAAWRRTLETNRALTPDDIEELEHHVRDEVRDGLLRGLTEEAAYRQALHDLGPHGETWEEYEKVFWPKARRQPAVYHRYVLEIAMLHNYIKIALRTFKKHTGFSLLNVVGMAVALASSLVILLYAEHELTYDRFHANADETYLLYKERHTAQGIRNLDDTWVPMLPEILADFPDVANGARMFARQRWVEANGKRQEEVIVFADPSYFDIFSFPVQHGDGADLLADPNHVLLSPEAATRLFGDQNPIGQPLTVNYDDTYEVAGILEPVPENATIQPGALTTRLDIVAPFASVIAPSDSAANNNWNGSFLYTFLQLNPYTTEEAFEAQLPTLVEKVFGTEGANGTEQLKMRLWPLTDLHDRDFGSDRYATIFLLIALGIIVIACINFMNLATARSLERAREVGMRKVLGAHRRQLVQQFLGESMVTVALALGLGLGLAYLLLPQFNALYEVELTMSLAEHPWLLAALGGLALGMGLLAGGYPAFVLSRFEPVETVKGRLQHRPAGQRLRQGLVVLQFALTLFLLIGTAVVWQQVRFMKTHDLNFAQAQVVAIPVEPADFADAEAAAPRIETIRNELLQLPGVQAVASSMEVPSRFVDANLFARPEDWDQPDPLRMRWTVIDDDYLDLYEMTFVEGRNFNRDIASDQESIILNETAMRDMGWTTAVGKKVTVGRRDFTVIGVVKDYHYESLESDIRAVLHFHRTPDDRRHNYVSIKLANGTDPGAQVAAIQARWQPLDPSRTFEYFFVDQDFAQLYRSVDRTTTLIGYFSLLGVLIACLGLLALASFAIVQRTKEIGVRKALGATTGSLAGLLAKQFTWPVLWANLLAWPVAYWMLTNWLADFAYRIAVPWWVFPAAALLVLALALGTIGYHALRAAHANPVTALRYE